MHPCPAWCLTKSQAIISLLSSLLYISISLAISPLLYLASLLWEGSDLTRDQAIINYVQHACSVVFAKTGGPVMGLTRDGRDCDQTTRTVLC